MSRQTRQRRIVGPQSALTDFLASHNISANQIRLDADARRRAAENDALNADNQAANQAGDADNQVTDQAATAEASAETPASETLAVSTSPAMTTRGRRAAAANSRDEEARKKEQKAIEKIKASKKFQKRKRGLDSDDEDELARALMMRSAPLPGQQENCEKCGKRFTVTAYSRNGPAGGLLCGPCSKELDKDESAVKKKKPAKRATGGAVGRRRQVQSNILDGTYTLGAKSLMTLCIEKLAKNIDLAEDLGDLPTEIIDKIARKLSKHRLLDPRTLDLFLRPSTEEVKVYDGAKLSSDDFIRIFQTAPGLKKLKVRNGIHFKDEVLDYLLSRHIELEDLYLHGANLVSEDKWKEFLHQKGAPLRSLRIYFTDKHVNDAVLEVLPAACPSLTRLKICHNQQVGGPGIAAISQLASLRHLSLDLRNAVHSDAYVSLLAKIGPKLQTLSLTRVPEADNTVLDAIHTHCRALKKLRITESEDMTDAGFVRLFTGWANPGLEFLDLQKCRQLDSAHPRANPDGLGLCSGGFRALMAHSGRTLRDLNVHGCRHIGAAAMEAVFAPGARYEMMKKLEISFCEEVTDFVVGSVFRSCPGLRELNVFGCMKVRDVRVPRGRILVGVPNARGMVIEGDEDEDGEE